MVLGLESYRTRLLLGYTLSLGLLLLLTHLSAPPRPTPPWLPHTNPDRILLAPVREVSMDEDGSDRTPQNESPPLQDDAPPQTRHSSAPSDAPSSTAAPPSEAPTSTPRTRPNLHRVTTITEMNSPELIGGLGAYYLNIHYPEPARKQGIQGRLTLHFTVTERGVPTDVQVLHPLHPLLDSAAVRALRSVRFRPATQNGLPVSMPMQLPVRFRLLSDSVSTQTADLPPAPEPSDAPNP